MCKIRQGLDDLISRITPVVPLGHSAGFNGSNTKHNKNDHRSQQRRNKFLSVRWEKRTDRQSHLQRNFDPNKTTNLILVGEPDGLPLLEKRAEVLDQPTGGLGT